MYEQANEKDKATCKYIENKHSKLKNNKVNWEQYWQELTRYYIPNKDDVWGFDTPGMRKGEELYDSTGRRCSEKLAAFLHSRLSNPSVQWFAFSTGDEDLDNDQDVALYLQTAATVVNNTLNNSNFHIEIHEVYLDLTSICTGHLQIEEDEDEIVRFESTPIYSCAINENFKGLVDTFYYEKKYTVERLIDKYGIENVGKRVADLQYKEPMTEFCVLHAIEPSRYMPENVRHPIMEYTSVHILKDENVILKRGGFEETPVAVPRFMKISGEVYGRGPSMYALPDVKTANSMMGTWLKGAQLAVNPPVQVPDEGALLPVKLKPNGVNYYRAGSQDRIEPILLGANPQLGHQIIELLHAQIEKTFHIDQIQVAENDRMTAYEVQTRKDENFRSFSPFLSRMPYELHSIAILRTFGILSRRGLLPAVPQILAKTKLEVKFVSQMARAQESIEGDTTMRVLEMAGGLIGMNQESADMLDFDKHMVRIYQKYGAPLDLLRGKTDVSKIREQRAQAQQEAMQAQLAKTNAEAGRNAAQADNMMRG